MCNRFSTAISAPWNRDSEPEVSPAPLRDALERRHRDLRRAREQPIQLVESGPAGGIIGAALIGALIGEPNLISLDIGGTTAKCSLIEGGEVKISSDYRIEWTPLSPGYPVKCRSSISSKSAQVAAASPGSMTAAPSGSVRSAGADPGPACYGRGGTEPTVTDAMLIAGVLIPTSSWAAASHRSRAWPARPTQPIAERLRRHRR